MSEAWEKCYSPTHLLDRAHVSWCSGDLNSTYRIAPPRSALVHSSTPRVHLLRAATASSRFHVHIHVGSTEPCSRGKFHFPWPRALNHLPATPTHSLCRNHKCNRSPRRHNCRFYMHQAHRHQCFRKHFLLEMGNATVTAIHVLIDTTFVRAATVAINDAIVCSHTDS